MRKAAVFVFGMLLLLPDQCRTNECSDLIRRLIQAQYIPSVQLPGGGLAQVGINRFRASIPELRFKFFAAPETNGRQRQSNWCWATCIQMILNYHGLSVSQEQIVNHIFGALIDRPGGTAEILTALNQWFPNLEGSFSRASAQSFDLKRTTSFLDLLQQGQPLIVGLKGSATNAPGHAYVLTGVEFSFDSLGRPTIIHSVTLRNPWPSSPSEETMPWEEFAAKFISGFAVTVPH